MSYTVRQHVPNWADVDPNTATVDTLDELLALPWVHSWTQGYTLYGEHLPFVGWRRVAEGASSLLMALYGANEEAWWVIARVPNELLADLPEWHISPAGQAGVDKWNRGEAQ